MPYANSSLNGSIGASLVAAAIPLRAMPDTNSAFIGFIGASLVTAAVASHFPARCSDHHGLSRLPLYYGASNKLRQTRDRSFENSAGTFQDFDDVLRIS